MRCRPRRRRERGTGSSARRATRARMAVAEMSRAVMRCKLTPRPDAWRNRPTARIIMKGLACRNAQIVERQRRPASGGRVIDDDVAEREDGRVLAPGVELVEGVASEDEDDPACRARPRRAARGACRRSTTGRRVASSTSQAREARAARDGAARPCAGGAAAGAMPSASLCGGTAAGTKRISSRPSASRTSSAARRCARWIGSKVPPRMPTPPLRPGAVSSADLAGAAHQVLVGRELAQPHRPARVQAVRADADLGAEAELEAVGEARRGVDEDRGRVDLVQEALGGAGSPR